MNLISQGQLTSLLPAHANLPASFGPVTVYNPPTNYTDVFQYDVDPLGVWATQPSVRKVVDFIARELASTPLKVYRRAADNDRQRVTDGPLAALAVQPDSAEGMSAFRWWHSIIVDWLIFDRWAAMKVASQTSGRGMDLVRVQAFRTTFADDGLARVLGISVDGHVWLPAAKCVFDHGYAVFTAMGTSPIQTLGGMLRENAEALQYRRDIWKRGARTPVVLERPAGAPDWSRPTPDGGASGRERFAQSWRNFMRGGGREGGTPILEDGMQLVKVDAFSPKETLDIQNRQLTDAEVSSAYHIAPELVGARPGNYSNMDAYRQGLYRESLGGYYAAAEQAWNTCLAGDTDLNPDGDLYVEFDLDAKLRGSFTEQAAVLSTAVGGPWMLRSEARGLVNLPALPNGAGDQLIVPLNVLEGGLASPRDTAPPKGRLLAPHRRLLAKSDRPDDLASVATERKALELNLTAYYGAHGDAILKALEGGTSKSLDGLDDGAWNRKLQTLVFGHSQRIAQSAAWSVLDTYNPSADGWAADVMDPWLKAAAGTRSTEMNGATLARVAAAVVAGGLDAVKSVLADVKDAQPGVWARTIGTESAGFGSHDAASASGLSTKTWETGGTNPRPSHAAMDGESVAIDDVFSNGLRYPGDSGNGDPDEVANCNCTISYSTP